MSSLSTESKLISSSKASFSRRRCSSCIVFSDVDGTLVHYPTHLPKPNDDNGLVSTNEEKASTLLHLPPSQTGSRGVISTQTLLLCHRLRHGLSIIDGDDDKKNDNSNIFDDDVINDANKVPRVPLVLISGMRTSTLFKRLPYLPRSDAYVCESGGRIFYPRPIMNNLNENDSIANGYVNDLVVQPVSFQGMPLGYDTPFILVEDMNWREQISRLDAAGSDGYVNNISIEHRRGKLWDYARTIIDNKNNNNNNNNNNAVDKYVIDADGYATAFRIRYRQNTSGTSSSSLLLPPLPDGLACSTNLGCVDIYPTMSGKRNCAEYLARKFLRHDGKNNEDDGGGGGGGNSVLRSHAYCLCDDDNDIEMALACRAAYLPSLTSESMRILASSDDNSLIVAEDEANGIVESVATEAALRALIKELQSVRE
ncbi:hypothetical protein ACHAWU_009140 [Discostella pseudostelligera]|uniref:Sucrose phosphatase-like domain-containing protein n=1 Tax=Discostella pseudostelligera TaxID=259834 RepID=A0ABD3N283_9STRA